MIAYVLILIALLGALLFFLSSKPDFKELGRLIFVCAFLWFCFTLTGKTVKLF